MKIRRLNENFDEIMDEKVSPAGAVFQFEYNDTTYYFLVYVDFVAEKVIGNFDIESEQCIVFDSEMNRVEYDNPIYEVVERYIDEYIVGH